MDRHGETMAWDWCDPAGDAGAFANRIRYTVFNLNWDGKLLPVSERPVILNRTLLTGSFAGQAGAAVASTARHWVRFVYPNGSSIDMRSEAEF